MICQYPYSHGLTAGERAIATETAYTAVPHKTEYIHLFATAHDSIPSSGNDPDIYRKKNALISNTFSIRYSIAVLFCL